MRSSVLLLTAIASTWYVSAAGAQIKIRPGTKAPARTPRGTKTNQRPPSPKSQRRNLILSDTRTYRFVVAKLEPQVFAKVERTWSFKNAFPPGLLAAVRKNAKHKKFDAKLLRDAGDKATGGYLRWKSAGKDHPDFGGALLTYIDGPKRKLLGLRIDVPLTQSATAGIYAKRRPVKPMGKKLPPHWLSLSFDGLGVTFDRKAGKLATITFAGRELPAADDKTAGVKVEDSLEVDILGMLTAESSKSIRAADELLSGDLLQKLQLLGLNELKNVSHHGITLGWLGHESVRHHLSFLVGKRTDPIAFRYRISGDAFPLRVVRAQLEPAGWPLVLTGHHYLGSADGVRVFRPVEFVLSRKTPEKPH